MSVCSRIGLWEPLTFLQDGHDKLNERFCRRAVEIKAVNAQDIANIKALSRPNTVRQVLIAPTQKTLPARMGLPYTELVTSCLSCLEGGFGDPKEFEENRIGMGVKIQGLGLGATFDALLERRKPDLSCVIRFLLFRYQSVLHLPPANGRSISFRQMSHD